MNNYLIIGAASGIGKRLAEILIEEGHKVYGSYFSSMPDAKSGISYYPINVLEERIDLNFLPEKLDGIVYCPGSINLKPFGRISREEFTKDFNLNVMGAVNIIQNSYKNLKASENPSIVLFSTIAVQKGFNFHSQVAVSKGAIEGLVKSLAAEFAPKIRVNAIAPSLTDTPLAKRILSSEEKKEANAQNHPLKRIGKPEDIANMASFLLSDKSSWITGQIIHVDGGKSSINT